MKNIVAGVFFYFAILGLFGKALGSLGLLLLFLVTMVLFNDE